MHTIVFSYVSQPGVVWFQNFEEKGKAEKAFLGKHYNDYSFITHISKKGKVRFWKSLETGTETI